jgi:hypothetical protein
MRLIRQHINIPDVGSRVRVSKLCQLDVEEILKEVDSKKKSCDFLFSQFSSLYACRLMEDVVRLSHISQ